MSSSVIQEVDSTKYVPFLFVRSEQLLAISKDTKSYRIETWNPKSKKTLKRPTPAVLSPALLSPLQPGLTKQSIFEFTN